MNNLNYALLDGALTRDPMIAQVTTNMYVCKFVIANNRYFKTKNSEEFAENTSYFLIETWGDLAHQCMNKLQKGTKVRVIGRLKQARWDAKGDPEAPRERIYIVAEHVETGYQKKPDILKSTEKGVMETDEVQKSMDTVSETTDAGITVPAEIPAEASIQTAAEEPTSSEEQTASEEGENRN